MTSILFSIEKKKFIQKDELHMIKYNLLNLDGECLGINFFLLFYMSENLYNK